MFTPAQDNDLTVFKQLWGDHICNTKIFADKIYSDFEYFNDEKKQKQHIEILTPVKAIKGQSQQERQSRKAYNDLFSSAVSKVRQPIESFFNWLNEKTTIQRAQKVRSTKGLLLHTMGKIAITLSNFLNTDSHNLISLLCLISSSLKKRHDLDTLKMTCLKKNFTDYLLLSEMDFTKSIACNLLWINQNYYTLTDNQKEGDR